MTDTDTAANLAILQDIATDPTATLAQRAAARRAIRSQRSAKNSAINRALQRARRESNSANRWQTYNEIKQTMPPMPPAEYEQVITKLARILNINIVASKRRHRRRSCERKRRHASKQNAGVELVLAKQRGVKRLTIYRCKFCGGYHVGHRPHSRHEQ